ncbi:KCNH6 [Symbiodinium sp. CCMP2456]|nr:KCNH6 [Symbiodinium sp. CCMP2456]
MCVCIRQILQDVIDPVGIMLIDGPAKTLELTIEIVMNSDVQLPAKYIDKLRRDPQSHRVHQQAEDQEVQMILRHAVPDMAMPTDGQIQRAKARILTMPMTANEIVHTMVAGAMSTVTGRDCDQDLPMYLHHNYEPCGAIFANVIFITERKWFVDLSMQLFDVAKVFRLEMRALDRGEEQSARLTHVCSVDDFLESFRGEPFKLEAAHRRNEARALLVMEAGIHPVFIDSSNLRLWEMRPYVLLAERLGYVVHVVEPWEICAKYRDLSFLAVMLDTAERRQRGRVLPRQALLALLKAFETLPDSEVKTIWVRSGGVPPAASGDAGGKRMNKEFAYVCGASFVRAHTLLCRIAEMDSANPLDTTELAYKLLLFVHSKVIAITFSVPMPCAVPLEEANGIRVIVDVFFGLDMILSCRTAFVDSNGLVNTVPYDIYRHYLKGQFLVDFLSTVPIDRIVEAFLADASNYGRVLKLTRFARIFRLMKLARMLKLFRLVHSAESSVQVSPLFLRLGLLFMNVCFLAHVVACMWHWLATLPLDPQGCVSGRLECFGDDSIEDGSATWLQGSGGSQDTDTNAKKYVAALYWVFTTMTTVGYGDIFPMNNIERVFAVGVMIFGATVFGYIVGSVAEMATHGRQNPAAQSLLMMRQYCEEHGFHQKVVNSVRRHVEFWYQEMSPFDAEPEILQKLPAPLRREVILHIHRHVIGGGIALFALSMPAWLQALLVRLLEPQAFAPGELIVPPTEAGSSSDLIFVYEGSCEAILNATGRPLTQAPSTRRRGRKKEVRGVYLGDSYLVLETYPAGTMLGFEALLGEEALQSFGCPRDCAVRCSATGTCSVFAMKVAALVDAHRSTPHLGGMLTELMTCVIVTEGRRRVKERQRCEEGRSYETTLEAYRAAKAAQPLRAAAAATESSSEAHEASRLTPQARNRGPLLQPPGMDRVPEPTEDVPRLPTPGGGDSATTWDPGGRDRAESGGGESKGPFASLHTPQHDPPDGDPADGMDKSNKEPEVTRSPRRVSEDREEGPPVARLSGSGKKDQEGLRQWSPAQSRTARLSHLNLSSGSGQIPLISSDHLDSSTERTRAIDSTSSARNPLGDFQQRIYEVGLVCLASGIVINFLAVHFWFRRKFLVSMPWYEYHKHGLGLHVIFLLMYANPQACFLFTCRLFDVDLFNIHFGTPSKMNEVLSRIGCLSLLSDTPLLVLKALVYFLDSTGIQAPKVTRVSMGVTVIHLALVLKRQYVSSVERQWYQEIVRMAGVRRLTTYGGASRWLKFQKRPSAAADLQGAGSSQQQLFLAWMQSMGRRQESIFQDAASKPPPPHTSGDADELSDDSEDLDSLSEDSDSEEEEEEEPELQQEGTSRPSRRSQHVHKPKDGHDSETDAADTPKMELQSHRGDRLGREERAMHRRGLGSKDEILGYARQVADEMGQSDGVSVSDIMMFAKRVAAHPSESGVVTESFGVDGFSNDMFSDNSLGGSALLRFARGVAQRGDLSSAGGTSAVEGDVLAFARKVAQQASESGIGTGITEGTDIMAFARKAARAVSQSGISQGASESDVLAFARKAAREISQSGIGANDSDILTFARKAADDVSKSGAVSETSVLAFARQVANGMHSEVTETSAATSRSDFLAFARRAAQDVSKSGVASSVASGAESDIYAFAQQVAGDVSRSGVHGASEAASSVRESDIFAIAQRHTGLPESKTSANPASSVASASDIMQFAQKVAQDVSEAGYSRASEASDARLLESRSGAESTSDVLAFARRAAQAVGSSTVPSEDLFVPARRVLREGSSVSGSEPEVQSLHCPSHAYRMEPQSNDFRSPDSGSSSDFSSFRKEAQVVVAAEVGVHLFPLVPAGLWLSSVVREWQWE